MAKNEQRKRRQLEKKRRKEKKRKKNQPPRRTAAKAEPLSLELHAQSAAVGAPPYFRELVFSPREETGDDFGLSGAELELVFFETQEERRAGENALPVSLIQLTECTQVAFPSTLAGGLAELYSFCRNPRLWRLGVTMHEYVDPECEYGKWLLRQDFVNEEVLAGESLLKTSFPIAMGTGRATKNYLPTAEKLGLQVALKQEEVVFWNCAAAQKLATLNELQVDRFWELLMFLREYVRLHANRGTLMKVSPSQIESEVRAIEEEEAAAKARLVAAFDALQEAETEIEPLKAELTEARRGLHSGKQQIRDAEAAISDPNKVRTDAANARAQALQLAAQGDTARAEQLMEEHVRLQASVAHAIEAQRRERRRFKNLRDQWLRQQVELNSSVAKLEKELAEHSERMEPLRREERSTRAAFDRAWWKWQ